MNRKRLISHHRTILLFAALAIAFLAAAALPAALGRASTGVAERVNALAVEYPEDTFNPRPFSQRAEIAGISPGPGANPDQPQIPPGLLRAFPAEAPLLVTDLALTKTATLEPALAGSPLGYDLTIRNQGPLTATGIILTDTLPMSVTYTASSPGCLYLPPTHQVSCPFASLLPATSALVTITVTVDPGAQNTLVNNALVTHDSMDTDPFDNADVLTSTVQVDADLALQKTGSPDPVTAGEALLYTLSLTNNGPGDLTSAVLTDTLPSGVSFGAASPGCGPAAGDVVCAVGGLPAGVTLPVTLSVAVDPATTGVLMNTAVVAGAEMDPDNANNSTGPVTTTVITSADLLLSKTDTPDPVNAGALLTYTLTITNSGPSNALGVALTDTLQTPEVSFVSVLPTPACSHAAGVVSCALGTLAPDEVIPVTLVVQVQTDATGPLANDAVATSSTSDPDGTGPTASTSTTVNASADLALSIEDDPDPVVAGSNLTYTLTLVNNGPSLARNISIADTLPADTSYINATTTQGTCGPTSGGVLCSLGDLDTGNTTIISILVSVGPGATGTLVNMASAISPTPDPVTGNNTASETTQISAFADLSLAKSGAPDPVTAGGILTYTLTVTNTGPSGADGTVLTDTLPGETTFLTALPPQGSCSETAGVVVCDLGTLGLNSTIAVPLAVTVDPGAAGSTLTNQAEVASGAIDPAGGNNTASLTTTVTASADLQVQKFDTPDALSPGEVLTYTVVVQNNGPSDAESVVLTDTLPAEVALLNIAPGPGAACSGTTVIQCNFAALAAGSSGTVQMVVLVDPVAPTGSIFNNAEVAAATPDPDLSNNVYIEETIIADQIVDLTITKADEPDPVRPDELLTYTLEVRNSGPSLATGVVMTDTLPAEVAFLQASASQGSCAQAAPVVCDLGDLPVDASALITILVTVDPGAIGLITNTASTASIEPDSNIDDNLIQEGTMVIPEADLALVKADGPDPVYISSNTNLSYPLTYTLTVSNNGPSAALSVTLTDTLPLSVTFVSAVPGAPACTEQAGVVTCELGGIPVGGSSEVTILTEVNPGDIPVSTTLTNQASVLAATADPEPGDNTATAGTQVIVDNEPPLVTWTLPVSEGMRLDVGSEILRLRVNVVDNNGIARVRFKRWDPHLLQWVYLDTVVSPPYEIEFDTSELFYEWNEVRAEAYDWAGNSIEPRIWLYRLYSNHLPIIRR